MASITTKSNISGRAAMLAKIKMAQIEKNNRSRDDIEEKSNTANRGKSKKKAAAAAAAAAPDTKSGAAPPSAGKLPV